MAAEPRPLIVRSSGSEHDYCNRYRGSARNSNTPDSTSGNIGLRVVADPESDK